jgi:DNA mismatch repair protein MutS2
MIYPENFEQKISFDTIRQLVANYCLSTPGKEKTAEMAFSSDYELIKTKLEQTNEFLKIIREKDNFPTDGFLDTRESLKKIRIEGAYLTEKELFDIRKSMETISAVLKFFKTNHAANNYPTLKTLASNIADFPHITRQIDAIIDKFGQIRSDASPHLADINRKMTQTVGNISRTLGNIMRRAQSEGFIDKDTTTTIRNGRLVIPVPPAFKRKIKGIVHDESATGKTIFIEPQEIVETNNRIRELENEAKRETVKILTGITNTIRPEIPEITTSYTFLAQIDFIRAKALFAQDTNSTMPTFENTRQLNLTRAIHPLLLISHRKQNKPVVPLDLELKTRILLVSGPNAGGKSVLLKTAGLLQYMLQSGMLIPVHENSKTGTFQNIFIDIGDEQSIENNLSTYSSHLTGMKFMIQNASNHSLILIDELGSGTEPLTGAAIAETLLHRLNQKNCFGIITTHYHNLKIYAEEHNGITNGAMLYDTQQMKPLFQLSTGAPGSSFAIEIARKIGLPEDIIAEASEKAGQDYINLDKYQQNILRDKQYWEQKQKQIRLQETQLQETEKHYKSIIETLEAQKRQITARAHADAEKLLADANAQIEKTIREIKKSNAEKEQTLAARKQLNNFKEKLKTKHPANPTTQKQTPQPDNNPLSPGDTVRLKGRNTAGTIISRKNNTFTIAFNSVKTTAKAEQLEKIPKHELEKTHHQPSTVNNTQNNTKLHFRPQIDLRGMHVTEALQAVKYYIDDAIQYSAGRVRILHGTGTGALRQTIREYLKTIDGIKHISDEHAQSGGPGITVVDLE